MLNDFDLVSAKDGVENVLGLLCVWYRNAFWERKWRMLFLRVGRWNFTHYISRKTRHFQLSSHILEFVNKQLSKQHDISMLILLFSCDLGKYVRLKM